METLLERLSLLIKGSEFENHVFLVGGAVRDSLLGIPNKDADFVIDLPNGGIEFANFITKKLNVYKEASNPIIYPTYGTAMFHIPDCDIDIECVMTRKEWYKIETGRKPSVKFGTLLEDAERRDLTFNALYKNISTNEIIDPTGKGINDLKQYILRTPADANLTFKDDPLRMMRVIRFYGKFANATMNDNIYSAITKNAKFLNNISKERIQDELNKILLLPNNLNVGVCLYLLQELGLMRYIIPEFDEVFDESQGTKYHIHSVGGHSISVCIKTERKLANRMAGLLHDIGKLKTKSQNGTDFHFYKHDLIGAEMIPDILKRLKYPNDFIEEVVFAAGNHMRIKQLGDNIKNISDKAVRKFVNDCKTEERLNLLLDVINADNNSHSPEYCLPTQVEQLRNHIDRISKIDNKECFTIKLPINGNDIIEIFNLKPGKQIGNLISLIKEAYLENPDITKEEAIDLIKINLK